MIAAQKKIIETLNGPTKSIQCVTEAEIIGHIMTSDNNLNDAINDRINKANIEWGTLRGKILGK